MCRCQNASTVVATLLSAAIVHIVRRVEPDDAVVMLVVVPGEEVDPVRARILQTAERIELPRSA